jgi:hypothetical protein
MSQEGGAGVSYKLITEGEVGYVGLGQVGSRGGLWLADGDGGECERGTGGWLAYLVTHAAASLLLFFYIAQDLHASSLLPFKHYKTKGRGYCYSKTRPERGRGAGVVNARVWWSLK